MCAVHADAGGKGPETPQGGSMLLQDWSSRAATHHTFSWLGPGHLMRAACDGGQQCSGMHHGCRFLELTA